MQLNYFEHGRSHISRPQIRGKMLKQLWVLIEGLTCFFFSPLSGFSQAHLSAAHTHLGSCHACFELVMDTRYKPKTCTTWVQSVDGHYPSFEKKWITGKKEADSTLVEISLGMGTDRNRVKVFLYCLQSLLRFIAVFKGLVCLLWVLKMRKNQKPETYVSFVTICYIGFCIG